MCDCLKEKWFMERRSHEGWVTTMGKNWRSYKPKRLWSQIVKIRPDMRNFLDLLLPDLEWEKECTALKLLEWSMNIPWEFIDSVVNVPQINAHFLKRSSGLRTAFILALTFRLLLLLQNPVTLSILVRFGWSAKVKMRSLFNMGC